MTGMAEAGEEAKIGYVLRVSKGVLRLPTRIPKQRRVAVVVVVAVKQIALGRHLMVMSVMMTVSISNIPVWGREQNPAVTAVLWEGCQNLLMKHNLLSMRSG